jgi:hypothetical protein
LQNVTALWNAAADPTFALTIPAETQHGRPEPT